MSYQFELKRVKSKLLGKKKHLVVKTEEGHILDHFPGLDKGIKKASLLDHVSGQGKRVQLDGKVYTLKNKSLNKFLIRNGMRLSFDKYSSSVHRAVTRGFENAIRFLPRKGLKKSEMRGKMILKCLEYYQNPNQSKVHFPYDDDPKKFKKGYKDALKWEYFFVSLWKS